MNYTTARSALFVATLIFSILFLMNCQNDDDPGSSAPEITGFSPEAGEMGTVVVITGNHFSENISDNQVTFNETPATITEATTVSLTVTVPTAATTGKIHVTVNGQTASSLTDFVMLSDTDTTTGPSGPSPVIDSIRPLYGTPGMVVTIYGSIFGSAPSVFFNGERATVETHTDTLITVTVPEDASSGKIKVTNSGANGYSSETFDVLKDIPRDGLVAFYSFTGSASDISGNDLHGTVTGAVLAEDRFGKTDQAYSFDGDGDFINMGNPPLLQISDQITVSGWVNMDAYRGTQGQAVVCKLFFDPSHGYNPMKGYYIDQDFYGNGDPSFSKVIYSSDGSGATTSFSSGYVGSGAPLNEWIFFALIIDDTEWKFYQNGVLTDEGNGAVTLLQDGSLGDFVLGNYGGGFDFNGRIDDVAVYDRPLTDEEITQLFEQNISKY